MEIRKQSDFTRGWIIGDFDPSIIKTKDFEVGVKEYRVGDTEASHIHKIAVEITVIISGKYIMNDTELNVGDVVRLASNEAADFKCLVGGSTLVIKMPSIKGDKYAV